MDDDRRHGVGRSYVPGVGADALADLHAELPANLLGLPAVCVPTGVANGLPTGAQIIGDLFREDLCLNAAEAVEAAVGVLTPIDPRP